MTGGLATANLCDQTGAVLVSYTYDAFGAVRSQSAASDNYWLFAGEQRDEESGLDYLRARYYDPETGRFLSLDPLASGYVYANNNPVNLVDPSGLVSVCTDWRDGVCNGTTNIPDAFGGLYYIAEDYATEEGEQYRVVISGSSGDVADVLVLSPNPGWHSITDDPEAAASLGFGFKPGCGMLSFGGGNSISSDCVGGGGGGPSGPTITFGHGARHLAGTNLSQSVVENAIINDIRFSVSGASMTGSFWGRIVVSGRVIIYRAHTLPNGMINVGTYVLPP
jgi:RHS repeat-associated protein